MHRQQNRQQWSRPLVEDCESRVLFNTAVTMWHNDTSLTATNPNETTLTLDNVNSNTFGKLRTLDVDGQVYAQPLYVPKVGFIKHGRLIRRNLVFVATQNNSVYAYDANRGSLIWHVRLMNTAVNETPVPSADVGSNDITPQIGITSTPALDRATKTLYVVAKAKRNVDGNVSYVQRLWALNLTNGARKKGGHVILRASVPGSGNASVNGFVQFNPKIELQRSALRLLNGNVYISFASHGDQGPYHGWVLAYNASDITQQTGAWNDTPNDAAGGIWMTGAPPSVDSDGNMFLVTGNGGSSAHIGGKEFGESIVRIPTASNAPLFPTDFFTAFNHGDLDANDFDLGSTGALLLPDLPGPHPHEAIFGSKEGKLYVVDRDQLGGFNDTFDDVIQTIEPNGRHGIFMTPSYFNGQIFFSSVNGVMQSMNIQPDGTLADSGTQTDRTFSYPGVNPSISANGTSNGIVWVLTKRDDSRGQLLAYNATDLANPIYSSDDAAGDRDVPGGNYTKFTSPTIADGKVMIGTGSELVIYGLL